MGVAVSWRGPLGKTDWQPKFCDWRAAVRGYGHALTTSLLGQSSHQEATSAIAAISNILGFPVSQDLCLYPAVNVCLYGRSPFRTSTLTLALDGHKLPPNLISVPPTPTEARVQVGQGGECEHC